MTEVPLIVFVPKYNRLKIILAEQDRSVSWLAERVGRHRNAVSRWVNNSSQPSVEMLYRIGEVLDVEVRELLVASKG